MYHTRLPLCVWKRIREEPLTEQKPPNLFATIISFTNATKYQTDHRKHVQDKHIKPQVPKYIGITYQYLQEQKTRGIL